MKYDPEWNAADDDEYLVEDEELTPPLRDRREGLALDLTSTTVRVVLSVLLLGLAALFIFLVVRSPGGDEPVAETAELVAVEGETVILPTFTPGPTATPPTTATPEIEEVDGEDEIGEEIVAGPLEVGGAAQVANTGASGVNVRSGPGLNFPAVVVLAEGTRLNVLEGPTEADEYTWWRVETGDGATSGWVAGDFLSGIAQ